jgi:hypothetical protein
MATIVASEVLNGRQKPSTPMNALSEILSLFPTLWAAPHGVLDDGAVILVVMGALIGMMSIGEPDDPTDL